VRRLLDDPTLAVDLGARARRRALEAFSPQVVAEAYLDTYEQVLRESRRRAA
jgi:glycosyltransferase involved in cell wall biosynthesis